MEAGVKHSTISIFCLVLLLLVVVLVHVTHTKYEHFLWLCLLLQLTLGAQLSSTNIHGIRRRLRRPRKRNTRYF